MGGPGDEAQKSPQQQGSLATSPNPPTPQGPACPHPRPSTPPGRPPDTPPFQLLPSGWGCVGGLAPWPGLPRRTPGFNPSLLLSGAWRWVSGARSGLAPGSLGWEPCAGWARSWFDPDTSLPRGDGPIQGSRATPSGQRSSRRRLGDQWGHPPHPQGHSSEVRGAPHMQGHLVSSPHLFQLYAASARISTRASRTPTARDRRTMANGV